MNEPAAMATVLGRILYPYGACVAFSAALGCLLFTWLWKKQRKGKIADGLLFALLAVPCCLLMARAGYCAVRVDFLAVDYSPSFPLRLDWGGYSLVGACLGLLLAMGLFKLALGVPITDTADLAVPAALLALAGIRLAEVFTTEGIGSYVDNVALQWFPLAVQDTYGDWVMPIFFWEAVTALILCGGLLVYRRRARRGDAALTGMLLFGLMQILLESLRNDDFLRFGFVRVNQLLGLGLVLFAIAVWLSRARPTRTLTAGVCLAVVASTGLMVWVEFALDKSSLSNILLYAVLCAALFVLAALGLAMRNRGAKGETARAEG